MATVRPPNNIRIVGVHIGNVLSRCRVVFQAQSTAEYGTLSGNLRLGQAEQRGKILPTGLFSLIPWMGHLVTVW